jgi:uncharacterized protein
MHTSVMPTEVETAPASPPPVGVPKLDLSRIAQDLQIRKVQVESVVQLLDEGNTVPFITRYRKERTGGLDEEVIRQIQARVTYLRQLADRKQTILKSIETQGKLTAQLREAILAAETSKRLEDLYLPYKPKKRTLATTARERGLEPLAQAIWNREPAVANLSEVLPGMINPEKELNTAEDVLLGVQHILAEQIAETADVRAAARTVLWETGKLVTTKGEKLNDGQGLEFKDYFEFTETVRRIPPHRILAINRGEKEAALKVHLEWDNEAVRRIALAKLPLTDHPHAEFLNRVADNALTRLLLPSLEREIRRELTEEAEDHAVRVFARNLRSLLLQPPLHGRRVLAIDPGFRTGCKVAALDEVGNLLEDAVIYPFSKRVKNPEKAEAAALKVEKPEAPPAEAAPPAASPEQVPATGAAVEPSTPMAAAAPDPAPIDPFPTNMLAVEFVAAPEIMALATATAEPENAPVYEAAAPSVVAPPSEPNGGAMVLDVSPPTNPLPAEPVQPARVPRTEAKAKLDELVRKHQLNVIAIGNGTACRETEELISELLTERLPELSYVIVNEAGASVYSASVVGREEFPTYDATLRGTISIGRRLQDPLSELVKIDPQSIGVGLYQHDIHPRRLKDSLDAVIESCVNYVGVDLNTASVPLLRHVSGLNQLAARELVDYRKQNGPFRSRAQLLQVPGIGPARYVQAAGFLKIVGGERPLDQTWIHPEHYETVQLLLADLGFLPESLRDKQKTDELRVKLKTVSPRQKAEELREKLKSLSFPEGTARPEIGESTVHDIIEALARPGRDPREDLPPPVFKKGILKLEDLQPGMELKGTVLNVVDFGGFVDIGLKDSGLVHISQMANRYIKNPYDMVAVGDVVTVWVLSVDQERRRVSLTMIRPGTERKPPERKSDQPRPARGGRPPRGRRPPKPTPQPANPQTAAQAPAVAAAARPAPATSAPPSRPAPRPRKPYREPPKPKLSKAALQGETPLRTFSELKAFFEAQREPPPTPAEAPAETADGATPPAPETSS